MSAGSVNIKTDIIYEEFPGCGSIHRQAEEIKSSSESIQCEDSISAFHPHPRPGVTWYG